MAKVYHVAVSGNDKWQGTEKEPFRTISKAAEIAERGDKVVVHAGEYREWVKPCHSGYSELSRITYEAAENEKVIIKGSEIINTWEKYEGDVWKAVLQNDFFGDYNPYEKLVDGDWLVQPKNIHTGDVYLNGKSFYEAASLDEVLHPAVREEGYNPPWTSRPIKILHPEDTVCRWYAEVGGKETTIYANFQGADPNRELCEINVRMCCFYPEKTGMNYITVRGFEMAQAACPWTPPTADQPGLLGANWSKGWIIENNIIHDAKCSGISIGKDASTGHNLFVRRYQKPGYQYQIEAVFRALQNGWSKEKIGSHVIRNNIIYDCGQNAIVGHMGSAFSEISGNHIFNIGTKHEYFGYEIAGVKLHAAIDTKIMNNRIHNCTLGIWLDWQAQGVRVGSNLLYKNDRDLYMEVTHGPHLIDNNILGSAYSLDNVAQGGAYINNLFCGSLRRIKVIDRATPYHFPHSTEVLGMSIVHSGDDRLFNNIFIGIGDVPEPDACCGTAGYDPCHRNYEEYIADLLSRGYGNQQLYLDVEQPVYVNGNVYFKGAKAYRAEEENYVEESFDPLINIIEEDGAVYIEMEIPKQMLAIATAVASTETLGTVRVADAIFDDSDGSMLSIDKDYFGCSRADEPKAGPFENIREGKNRIKVWG